MPEIFDENGLRRSTYFLLSMPIAPPQSIVPAPADRHVAGSLVSTVRRLQWLLVQDVGLRLRRQLPQRLVWAW